MSKIFICDNCQKQFPQPLDEVMYKDDNGELHLFDLCAPCRSEKKVVEEDAKQTYFSDLIEKGKVTEIKVIK